MAAGSPPSSAQVPKEGPSPRPRREPSGTSRQGRKQGPPSVRTTDVAALSRTCSYRIRYGRAWGSRFGSRAGLGQLCRGGRCCIDKTSSAELSEAINSMFGWYSRSGRCYVFLADVLASSLSIPDDPHGFEKSEWFKRGWTLQELIAPESIKFFDARWQYIGSKRTLLSRLAASTSVPEMCLRYTNRIFSLSVADRMALAIGRKTSRLEDRAYSLMGLFQVNMPLLYGEGHKAFQRLQREVIMKLDDHSLLVHNGGSLLADDVYDFVLHRSPKATARSNIAATRWKMCYRPVKPDFNEIQREGVMSFTGHGIEIYGGYLEYESRHFPHIRLRLIAIDYSSPGNNQVPMFIPVFEIEKAKNWLKLQDLAIKLVPWLEKDDIMHDGLEQDSSGRVDTFASAVLQAQACIREYVRCLNQDPPVNLLKYDTMYVR